MEIKTTFYEDWMKDQIIDLICGQYGYDKNEYINQFSNFYEPDFQKSAIKVVLLDGKKVAGFMGFFYWPYKYNGKTYRSYQAGNVIVDPNYRGQQIFHKMVEFMGKIHKERGVDLLMGFPVDVAFNTYIRNGWVNIFDLHWYLKINNPFSILFPLNKKRIEKILNEKKIRNINQVSNLITLDDSDEFISWREGYYKSKKYYYTVTSNNLKVQFGLKLNVRKKIINELIIGEISTENYSIENLTVAVRLLLKRIKKIRAITIVSFAINSHDEVMTQVINNVNFRKIDKKIFFVAKNFTNEDALNNNSKWSIFRGDLDTW